MRFFYLLLLLGWGATSLRADPLATRLRLLLPGEEAATVNERQFLYQRLSEMFRQMEEQKVGRKKSAKKRVGRITDFLEDYVLLEHRAGAGLVDALRRGHYDDASAAVVTALALEHFQVDYFAVVDHWEAYLVADPDDRKITLRHPGSKKRKEGQEAAFRANFVELLRATVVEDAPSRSREEIAATFSQYYYVPDRLLTFGQLSAYLLFRGAQAAYDAEDYQRAVELSRKASARENRPAFLALRKAAELQLTALTNPEQTGDIEEFFQLWTEDPDNGYFPAAILNHFDEQQQILLAQEQPELARKLLDDYASRAPAGSAPWEQELLHLHRYRLVNHYFARGQLDRARQAAESLYADDPTNEGVRYLLAEILIADLRRTTERGEAFQARVQRIAEQFPFVRRQDRFADLLLREIAWKVRDLYAVDRAAEADAALQRFRSALVDIPIGRERALWTLTAFYSASDYHFRQQDYVRARALVDEALRYAPDDQFLLHQKDLLARY